MVGTKLLQRQMRHYLEIVGGDKLGSMSVYAQVQLLTDNAEGLHHRLQHGGVHRDVRLDIVTWRHVLVNRYC